MAYGDSKDLAKRTASDKVLRDKAFNIAKNPKHNNGYQSELASMVYKFFDTPLHLHINLLQAVVLICMQIIKNYPKNYTNQLLKKFKK